MSDLEIRGNASLYSGKHVIVKTRVGNNSVDAHGVYFAGSDVLAHNLLVIANTLAS